MSKSVAILISRQPRHLTPQTWWLCAARAAADWAIARGWTLVSGRGLPPIDYTRWYFADRGGRVEDVELEPTAARGGAMADRDKRVTEMADTLIAVKVSGCGNMERLALDALAVGKPVHVIGPPSRTRAFQGNLRLLEAGAARIELEVTTPPDKRSAVSDQLSTNHITIRANSLDPLAPRPVEPCNNYLWHFTRSCPGPWPGQLQDDYFRSLTENAPGAAHSGFDALTRITNERLIRACPRMFRGSFPMVSFTECAPDELLQLRAYRPSLIRWSFEPYAVGISRSAAGKLGARPAAYLPARDYDALPDADKPFFQKHEPPDVDYSREREWRIAGDVNLADVDPSDMRIWL